MKQKRYIFYLFSETAAIKTATQKKGESSTILDTPTASSKPISSGQSRLDIEATPTTTPDTPLQKQQPISIQEEAAKPQNSDGSATKAQGIRTRLSTGSIQMNGTMTISAAKEKQEMEQILKQISKGW